MKNYNLLFASNMIVVLLVLVVLSKPSKRVRAVFWNIPKSKGCVWPVKIIKYTKTEIKHIVPVAQTYKCAYDKYHRLIKVSTYNFERGYQMKKPTEEVIYVWNKLRISQYSVRKATHGNGEIDVEVYRFNH